MGSLISQRTQQSGTRVEPVCGRHRHTAGSAPRNGKSPTPPPDGWGVSACCLRSCLGANQPKPGVLVSFTVRLCLAQVEYSQRYAETTQAHSLCHLLGEAHILLRAALLQRGAEQQSSEGDAAEAQQTDPQEQKNHRELDEALTQNCAQLGDCFSRSDGENSCKQPCMTSDRF